MHRIINNRLSLKSAAKKSNRGFTLTEVVVASALLLVISVPMLKALTSAYTYSNSIARKTKSVMYAQSRLDRARSVAAGQYNTSLTENDVVMGDGYLCSIRDTGYSGDIRTVTVLAGLDQNANGSLALDEIEITLHTKIARR